MTPLPRLIAVTFLLAFGGVLFMVGAVLDRLLGRVALLAYLLLLASLVVAIGVSARRRSARLAAGRTCTCCTGTVHDPVQVI